MTDAPQIEPRARTVRDFCRAYGVGKTTAWELIAAGRLVAVKAGRRILIDEGSAREWYDSLPTVQTNVHTNVSSADYGEP